MRINHVFFTLSLFTLLFLAVPANSYAAKKNKLCLKEDGSFVVKRKCNAKKNEQELNLASLTTQISSAATEGPQGSKGDMGDTGSAGTTGDQGSKGDQGDNGEQGTKGDMGSMDITPVYASHTDETVAAGEAITIFAGFCPTGKYSISGSCKTGNTNLALVEHSVNAPHLSDHFSYTCIWRNDTGAAITTTFETKMFCVSIPS